MKKNNFNIIAIGDSLSTNFYVSGTPKMIWRARTEVSPNWFMQSNNSSSSGIESLCDLLQKHTPLNAYQLSRVSSKVLNTHQKKSLSEIVLNTHHFSDQINTLLKLKMKPDLVLIWIGHNNIDWVEYAKTNDYKINNPSEVIENIVLNFEESFKTEITRLINFSSKNDKKMTIVLLGLIDFKSFFESREKAEKLNENNPNRFIYLNKCFAFFESMLPEYRDQMILLGRAINDKLESIAAGLTENPISENVNILYSPTLYDIKIDSTKLLSSYDAWHPSQKAHSLFAKAIYDYILKQKILVE